MYTDIVKKKLMLVALRSSKVNDTRPKAALFCVSNLTLRSLVICDCLIACNPYRKKVYRKAGLNIQKILLLLLFQRLITAIATHVTTEVLARVRRIVTPVDAKLVSRGRTAK